MVLGGRDANVRPVDGEHFHVGIVVDLIEEFVLVVRLDEVSELVDLGKENVQIDLSFDVLDWYV